MTRSIDLRLFVAGAIFIILVVFSRALTAQISTLPETVNELPPSSERWALVIGVSKYDDPALNPLYGQNDAKKIATDLERYAGFDRDQIFLLTDDQPKDHQPTRERILFWLSDLKQHASPQGLLLVFFSGHGMESQGESYLMPKDAYQSWDATYLQQNAVRVKDLSDSLRGSYAKQIIVLVDACRNNAYAAAGNTSNLMTKGFADSFNYEKHNRGIEAYATIFSTSLGQESFQYHTKEMGYFSWVLDQSLTGAYGSGNLTLANLIEYLQTNVPKLVSIYNPGREQKPDLRLGGYLSDRLVLARGLPPPPPQPSVPVIPAASSPVAQPNIPTAASVSPLELYLAEQGTHEAWAKHARTITGKVMDVTQAVIPNALVAAITNTKSSYRTLTDDNGHYRVKSEKDEDIVEFVFYAAGFKLGIVTPLRKGVTRLDVELDVGDSSEREHIKPINQE